jgi:Fic family protein
MRYTLDQAALEAPLREMEELRHLVAELPMSAIHEDWFRRRNWVRAIHGTTHIEGNTLGDEQVEEVLVEGPGENVSRREALEVVNTRTATAFADQMAADLKVAIDEPLVREIHRLVLEGIAELHRPGEYRRGENRVTDGDGNLLFITPVSGDVPELMRGFGLWLREGCDSLRPPIAAALAHLELVAIHPFYDGNGRSARLLARTLLRRDGYIFRNLVSLDAQLDNDRPNYFKAIRAAIGQHYVPGYDTTPFVTYFVSAISASIHYSLERIALFNRVVDQLRDEAAKGRIPAASVDPLAYTWVNRAIRPARYRELTGRSPQLVTYDLRKLNELGFLQASGATRRRKHMIGPALDQLAEEAKSRPMVRTETERDIFRQR